MKIKKLGERKNIRLLEHYNGLAFDDTHVMSRQGVAALKSDNDEFQFKTIDRYVKIYERVEALSPNVEFIIPRRLTIKKRLPKRKTHK
jgi:hypothetical protein